MSFSNTRSIGSQAEQLWTKGQGAALIVNNDLTNLLYVSNDTGISSSNVTVPPLGSMAVDGSINWFGSTLSNTVTIQVQIMPGATQWSPSPAQVAAQINALGLATATNQVAQNTAIPNNISTTGVPLLTLNNVSAQGSAVAIGANSILAIPVSGKNSVSQIGFELLISAQYSSTNGTIPFLSVAIEWYDQTTGLLIDQDIYTIVVSAVSPGLPLPTRLKGPTKGNAYTVSILNLDTAKPVKISYAFLLNSRVYTTESIDWLVSTELGNPVPTIPAFTVANNAVLPDSNVLGIFSNASLGASDTDSWLIPARIGPLYLNIWETGVAGANMQVSVQEVPSGPYGTNWLINDVMASGNPNKYTNTFYAGRAPIQINIKNGGSVGADYIGIVTSGATD